MCCVVRCRCFWYCSVVGTVVRRAVELSNQFVEMIGKGSELYSRPYKITWVYIFRFLDTGFYGITIPLVTLTEFGVPILMGKPRS